MLTVEIKRELPYRFIRWKTIGNIYHNYRAPIYTSWSSNGRKSCEEYRVSGKLHREPTEGPAATYWDYNGQKFRESYWVNGRCIHVKDYQC